MNWTAKTETFDGARACAPHDEPHDWSELKFNLVVSEVAPHQMALLREELDALVEWLRRGVGEPAAAKVEEAPPPPPVPEWANRVWVDPASGASYVTAPAVGPCDHKGGAVYWNEFNSTFQCHQCGEVAKFAVGYAPAKVEFQWEPGEGDIKDTLVREFGEATLDEPGPDEDLLAHANTRYTPDKPPLGPDTLVQHTRPPVETREEWVARVDDPPAGDGEALRAAVAATMAGAPVEVPVEAEAAVDPAPPLPTHVGAMKDRLRASAALMSERYDDLDEWEGA